MIENVIEIKIAIMINVVTSAKIKKSEKDYIWNPATCKHAKMVNI